MKLTGKVWKYGSNVNTDVIIPARYLNQSDPQVLAKHCLEDLDPEFISRVRPGDIIVAGENFGCGSSREHAPIAIKAVGVSCVIAASYARIFYRNSFNMGLPIFESAEIPDAVSKGDELEVDTDTGEVKNLTTGETYRVKAIPAFMQELIADGGLMKHLARKHDLPGASA